MMPNKIDSLFCNNVYLSNGLNDTMIAIKPASAYTFSWNAKRKKNCFLITYYGGITKKRIINKTINDTLLQIVPTSINPTSTYFYISIDNCSKPSALTPGAYNDFMEIYYDIRSKQYVSTVSLSAIKKIIPLERGNCWTYSYKIDSFNTQTETPIKIVKTGKIRFSLDSVDEHEEGLFISLNCIDSGLASKISYFYITQTVPFPVDTTFTSYQNNFKKKYGFIDGAFKSYNSSYFIIDSILSYCNLPDSIYQDNNGHYKRLTYSKKIMLNDITDYAYIRSINYLKSIQYMLMEYRTDFYTDTIAWFKNIGILHKSTFVNNALSNRYGSHGISISTQWNLSSFNGIPINLDLP
jgi:hypothetical protein